MKRDTSTIRRRKQTDTSKGQTGQIKMYALMFVCLVVVIAGFFLAARQHFSSMDYGMRNSKLRKQLDDLESEKRRLLLAREVSLSPAEIKKAAQNLGVDDLFVASPQMASISNVSKAPVSPSDGKNIDLNHSTKYVVRTAYVESSTKPQIAARAKGEVNDREKKEKSTAAALVSVR